MTSTLYHKINSNNKSDKWRDISVPLKISIKFKKTGSDKLDADSATILKITKIMDKRYSHSNLFQSVTRIHSHFSRATLLRLIDCHHQDQGLAKKNDRIVPM